MGSWVPDRLLPHLKTFVGNALGRRVEVFVDRAGIHSGDNWPERLHRALATSRCMVAVWHPLYFSSEWCRKEFGAMLLRESRLGLRTVKRPGGLVAPVRVNDGDRFPAKAKAVQSIDCSRFWRDGEAFTRSERYIEFQDVLEAWAADVAACIRNAPEWDASWLLPEWLPAEVAELHPQVIEDSFVGLE